MDYGLIAEMWRIEPQHWHAGAPQWHWAGVLLAMLNGTRSDIDNLARDERVECQNSHGDIIRPICGIR